MLPDSLVRAGAREASEGQAEKVASACSHYWTSFLCYFLVVTATGDLFVPLSTCCSCKATWIRFRGVDIDRAYLRWTTIGKRTSWEMCVTLGRSSFGEEFLTFQPTIVVPRAIQ
jgi:hypothetical protein